MQKSRQSKDHDDIFDKLKEAVVILKRALLSTISVNDYRLDQLKEDNEH